MAVYKNFHMSPKLNTMIEEVVNDLILAEGELDKSSPFRSSSFPYCPIIDLENRISGEFGFEDKFSSSFFTMIGTAVHENFQLWAPRLEKHKDKIWGNWACRSCGEKDTFGDWIPQVRYSLQPKACKCKGGGGWQYLEVSFKAGDVTPSGYVTPIGFSIDMIFEFPQGFVLKDFKTTGLDKLQAPNWKLHFPQHGNVCQLSNYSVLFDRAFEGVLKKRVVAWALVYLSREHVTAKMSRRPLVRVVSNVWDEKEAKKWGTRLDRAIKGRKAVEKLLDTGEAKYAKSVVKLRPCQHKGEYHDWMAAKFQYRKSPDGKSDNHCPHYKGGKCTANLEKPKTMVARVEFLAATIEQERRDALTQVESKPKKKKKKNKKSKKR